jgi:hypothetical protein
LRIEFDTHDRVRLLGISYCDDCEAKVVQLHFWKYIILLVIGFKGGEE